jgi:hypothetical protein
MRSPFCCRAKVTTNIISTTETAPKMVMSESEEVDGSGKHQKRGPFLPVNEDNDADLLADGDNDDDYDLKQEQRKTNEVVDCQIVGEWRQTADSASLFYDASPGWHQQSHEEA